jgi:hypothetical protein
MKYPKAIRVIPTIAMMMFSVFIVKVWHGVNAVLWPESLDDDRTS